MRKLLALFAFCLLPLAAHAQQGAPSRLKPAALAVPSYGPSRYCTGCAEAGDFAPGGLGAPAPGTVASSDCSPRGTVPATSPTASPTGRRGFDLSAAPPVRRLWFVPTPEGASAGLAARALANKTFGGARNTSLSRPALTFSRARAAAKSARARPTARRRRRSRAAR